MSHGKGQPELLYGELSRRVRQVAFDVHNYFGGGFLEKVYENALAHRLTRAGMSVATQVPLSVRDEDGTIVGQFSADMIIDDVVLVEVKARSQLIPEHSAQVINYLKVTGIRLGILLNFNERRLQIKRLIL